MPKRSRDSSSSMKGKKVQKVEVVHPSRKRATKRRLAMSLGQPLRKTVIMPYNVNYNYVSASAGNALYYYFRANGIFDPDYQVGGHQPMSHDQWALFYSAYVVKYCTITCTFTPNTAVGSSVYVGIQCNDDATTNIQTYANLSNAIENKHIRYRMIPIGYTEKPVVLSYRFSPLKFLNRSKYSTDVKAAFTADPTEQALLIPFICPTTATGTVGDWAVDIRIAYTVEMFEPKELGQS